METAYYLIFSDASFSRKSQLAVAGFLIVESTDENVESHLDERIQTIVFKEKNNIRVELRGVIFALETAIERLSEKCVREHGVALYTDCQSIAHLLDRRERLESANFMSKRKKEPLSNADLYQRFFSVYDRAAPNIFWVKGHNPKRDRDHIQRYFAQVDNTVRKILRRNIGISKTRS